MKRSKKILIILAVLIAPVLAFAQAHCVRHYTPLGNGLTFVHTTCNNPESNTWWVQ